MDTYAVWKYYTTLLIPGMGVILGVLSYTAQASELRNMCPTNFSDQVVVCLKTVEDEYRGIVHQILEGDKSQVPILCREYEAMYGCLHRVLDPCGDVGEYYLRSAVKTVKESVGRHCPRQPYIQEDMHKLFKVTTMAASSSVSVSEHCALILGTLIMASVALHILFCALCD